MLSIRLFDKTSEHSVSPLKRKNSEISTNIQSLIQFSLLLWQQNLWINEQNQELTPWYVWNNKIPITRSKSEVRQDLVDHVVEFEIMQLS